MEEDDNILESNLKNVARSPYNIENIFSTITNYGTWNNIYYEDGKNRISVDKSIADDIVHIYEFYKSGIVYSSREYNTHSARGIFYFYDTYGNLLLHFTSKDDVLHGLAYVYMPKIKYTVIKYINGIRDKSEDSFDISGNILWKCKYADTRTNFNKILFDRYGKKRVMITVDGINKRESFFTGKFISREKIYINDILDSTIDYFSCGQVKRLKYYKNNVQEGLQTKYFSTGEKSSISEYKAGKLNGKKIRYYENNYIHSDEIYRDGQLHGLQKYYYTSGYLHIEVDYINGQIEGSKLIYYENGDLSSDTKYKDNIPTGFSILYDKHGYISNLIRYVNGKKIV